MPYITSIERMAYEEGREIGREEGREIGRIEERRAFLTKILEHRFGPLDAMTQNQINQANPAGLNAWLTRIFSRADIKTWLAPKSPKEARPQNS